MTRAERHAQVKALKESGLTFDEIAADLGLARSTVTSAYYDPTSAQERARKDRYRGTCDTCGGPTYGGAGPDAAPTRCHRCTKRAQHDGRHWTPERVIAALRSWAHELGRTPSARDATRAGARVSQRTVRREFGSWQAGLRAAGLMARQPGHYGRAGEDPAVIAETVRLYLAGLTLSEVAARLNCGRETARWRLGKAGVTCRTAAESLRTKRARTAAATAPGPTNTTSEVTR
jgi:DNA-binding CsgD family transcriptional regulator